MSPQALLAFTQLTFERDDWPLFSHLSGQVDAGEILQITGPNGCGKTTLLHILATLQPFQQGRIYWQGQDIASCRQDYHEDLVFIGHQAGLKAALSPRENLQWLSQLHPLSQCSIDEALEKVGLEGFEDVACHTLSAGQLRRTALATLHMTTAKLWLLDEPLTALDANAIKELEALLIQHVEAGGGVVLSSHQLLSSSAVRTLALDDMSADTHSGDAFTEDATTHEACI